ncbi:MAG: lipid-binding SYLF domain-containing protein [Candidatus Parcubacteria bacterium]|nr:lipid-binding SYLF domain-containing protein [Burkholderiales bacterium]
MKKPQLVLAIAAAIFLALSPVAHSQEKKKQTPEEMRAQLAKDVPNTIANYRKTDPGLERFFKESAGYAVFPRIGKGGFIIAGGHGAGEVFEKGQMVGTASITLASIGLQAGAQEFSEIIFFSDAAALDRFKQNKFEFTANVSAVVIKAGASKGANYRDGVAVFTQPTGGAMVEAALGTQKFSFKPEARK